MKKDTGNFGISMDGGTLNASSIVVGDHATIYVSSDIRALLGRELFEIKALINSLDMPPRTAAEARAAVATLEEEVAKQKPNRSIVTMALDTLEHIGKVGNALVPLGEKLAPHLIKLAALRL